MRCGIHGRVADGVRAGRAVGVTVGFPRTATDRLGQRHIPPRSAAELDANPDGSCSRARRDGPACLRRTVAAVRDQRAPVYAVERRRGVCSLSLGRNRLLASESRIGPTPREDEDKGL
jgi:hypothetical protein